MNLIIYHYTSKLSFTGKRWTPKRMDKSHATQLNMVVPAELHYWYPGRLRHTLSGWIQVRYPGRAQSLIPEGKLHIVRRGGAMAAMPSRSAIYIPLWGLLLFENDQGVVFSQELLLCLVFNLRDVTVSNVSVRLSFFARWIGIYYFLTILLRAFKRRSFGFGCSFGGLWFHGFYFLSRVGFEIFFYVLIISRVILYCYSKYALKESTEWGWLMSFVEERDARAKGLRQYVWQYSSLWDCYFHFIRTSSR